MSATELVTAPRPVRAAGTRTERVPNSSILPPSTLRTVLRERVGPGLTGRIGLTELIDPSVVEVMR